MHYKSYAKSREDSLGGLYCWAILKIYQAPEGPTFHIRIQGAQFHICIANSMLINVAPAAKGDAPKSALLLHHWCILRGLLIGLLSLELVSFNSIWDFTLFFFLTSEHSLSLQFSCKSNYLKLCLHAIGLGKEENNYHLGNQVIQSPSVQAPVHTVTKLPQWAYVIQTPRDHRKFPSSLNLLNATFGVIWPALYFN